MEGRIDGAAATTFGKYELFASLGRGGMADVFLAVVRGQMGFERLAVIKRLREALESEAELRDLFLGEARLAERLRHPNIVHTYEIGERGGAYFIAMEYLEGQPLDKVLNAALRRQETIAPSVVVSIVAEALAGLAYAHDLCDDAGRPLGVVHRDVSPHNIFVTYDGQAKLMDFGIAALTERAEPDTGVLRGKVADMSPEQAMGEPVDARSDLFAMGIVLWELLAQRRLMVGESAASTIHKLVNEPIPRISEVVPAIDRHLDEVVARALEKAKARRFRTATDMRQALEAWLPVQGCAARHDEVSRTMLALFGDARDEVRRQIDKYAARERGLLRSG